MIHERLLALHGGAPGIRDQDLLLSALSRPRQHLAYTDDADVIRTVATYTYTAGIVNNQSPFRGR